MPKFPGAVGQQKKRRAKQSLNMSQAERDMRETPELVESMTFHRLKQNLLPQVFVQLVMSSEGFDELLRKAAAAQHENAEPARIPEARTEE